jgi:hypothetical protein
MDLVLQFDSQNMPFLSLEVNILSKWFKIKLVGF